MSNILVAGSFLAANLVNVAILIFVPHSLPASEFAEFSILWATSLFIVSLSFEWIRFSVIRFSQKPEAVAPLIIAYIFIIGILVVAIGISALMFGFSHIFLQIAAVIYVSIFQAIFEGRQAFLRARFLNRAFSTWVLVRSIVALALVLPMAFLTRDGVLTFVAIGVSYTVLCLACFTVPHSISLSLPILKEASGLLRMIAIYGFGVAVSSIVNSGIQPVMRYIATQMMSASDAGALMLAIDFPQKIIGVIGLLVNLITLQISIRLMHDGDYKSAVGNVERQIGIVCLLIFPATVGLLFVQADIAGLVVPIEYHDVYFRNITWTTVAVALMTLRVFAFDAIFVVAGKSKFSAVGAMVNLAVSVTFAITVVRMREAAASEFSLALMVGGMVGLFASYLVAKATFTHRLPWRDIGKITLASAVMALCLHFVPMGDGMAHLMLSMVAGTATFGLIIILTDACGIRQFVCKLI